MLSASWPKTNNIALQELGVNGAQLVTLDVTLPSGIFVGNLEAPKWSKMPICSTMPNLSTISLSINPSRPGWTVLLALPQLSDELFDSWRWSMSLCLFNPISSYLIISLIKSNVSHMFECLSNHPIYIIQSNRSIMIYLSCYKWWSLSPKWGTWSVRSVSSCSWQKRTADGRLGTWAPGPAVELLTKFGAVFNGYDMIIMI